MNLRTGGGFSDVISSDVSDASEAENDDPQQHTGLLLFGCACGCNLCFIVFINHCSGAVHTVEVHLSRSLTFWDA